MLSKKIRTCDLHGQNESSGMKCVKCQLKNGSGMKYCSLKKIIFKMLKISGIKNNFISQLRWDRSSELLKTTKLFSIREMCYSDDDNDLLKIQIKLKKSATQCPNAE